ncbi:MAG TPA: glycosyltransferase family 2 protein [Acidobacteriaceae bacterium]
MKLSVCIITLNEEKNIARTLASVAFAQEIIVVDSGSTDRTVEIAREHGAQVFYEPWAGFAGQKNSAIDKCTGDWILSLDADEELSPELQSQIRVLLPSRHNYEAYAIPRRNLFLGRWIKHGGFYPDPKLRLFKRGTARFEERPVHETMVLSGTYTNLDCDILHHAYPSLNGYIRQMNHYSTLGAEIAVSQGKISSSWLVFVTNILLRPVCTFLWNYIFRLGFLDGREGMLLHLYHSCYVSWKYAKAWRLGGIAGAAHKKVTDRIQEDESKVSG